MNRNGRMDGMRLFVTLALCLIFAPASAARAQNPSARAYVDPLEATAGETIRVMVEVTGVGAIERVVLPWMPPNLASRRSTVAVRVGDSEGGVTGNVFVLTYEAVYNLAGSFEVGPFEITADGQTIETEPVVVQVNHRDGAEVTVTAQVTPERVRVGDDFRLLAEIVGPSFAEPRFIPPDVFDFAELGRPFGSETSRSWSLRAVVPGEFVIPPVRVTGPGGTYESEPLNVVIDPPEVEVQAIVEAGAIWVGGEFVIRLEVTGATELDEEPVLPETGAFAEWLALEDSSSSFAGTVSRRVEREYRYRALRAGQFEIGPVEVAAGGRTLTTAPIGITVDEVPTLEADPPGSLLFMGSPDKTRVYVNEPVIVTYALASDLMAAGFGPMPGTTSWPSFDGVEVFELRRSGGRRELLGRTFDEMGLRRVALVAGRPGLVSVDGSIAEARTGWPRTMTSLVLASEPFTLEVLPLPADGRPQSFHGFVGTLSVESWVDRTRVEVGETVTLQVEVSLEGHVETLPDPRISFPTGFAVSEPDISTTFRDRRGVLSGSRTYIYRLTAVNPGTYQVPAVEMSYFNAESESYGTARGQPFTITVVPAGEGVRER